MAEWRLARAGLDYADSDYIPPGVQEGHAERTAMVAALVREVRRPGEAVCDLGCNAGHLLEAVGPPCWGYDVAESPLAHGRGRGMDVRRGDITGEGLELAPVVTVTEVLEHLDDPHSLVERLAADPVRAVIASGPYLETPESFYEQHVWAWDLPGFSALFTERGFGVHSQRTAGIFQALVAER